MANFLNKLLVYFNLNSFSLPETSLELRTCFFTGQDALREAMDLFPVVESIALAVERVERARALIERIASPPLSVLQLSGELRTISALLSHIRAFLHQTHINDPETRATLAPHLQDACERCSDASADVETVLHPHLKPSSDLAGSTWSQGLQEPEEAKILALNKELVACTRILRMASSFAESAIKPQVIRELATLDVPAEPHDQVLVTAISNRGEESGAKENNPFTDERYELEDGDNDGLRRKATSSSHSVRREVDLSMSNPKSQSELHASPAKRHTEPASGIHFSNIHSQPPRESSALGNNTGTLIQDFFYSRPPAPPAAGFYAFPQQSARNSVAGQGPPLFREYYPPSGSTTVPFTDLPRATDVQGRWVQKKAVSRAALQLAGIEFTEYDDGVQLHNDPGSDALRELRALSLVIRDTSEWWSDGHLEAAQANRFVGFDVEHRRKRSPFLLRPWSRKGKSAARTPVNGAELLGEAPPNKYVFN